MVEYKTDTDLETANLADDARVYVQMSLYGREVEIMGRVLVHRPDRDRDVIYANGVRLIAGTVPSYGGSRNRPSVDASKDARIEIANVPIAMYKHIVDEEDGHATWSTEPTPAPVSNVPTW